MSRHPAFKLYRVLGLVLLVAAAVLFWRHDWLAAGGCLALGAILWRGRPGQSQPTREQLRERGER